MAQGISSKAMNNPACISRCLMTREVMSNIYFKTVICDSSNTEYCRNVLTKISPMKTKLFLNGRHSTIFYSLKPRYDSTMQ